MQHVVIDGGLDLVSARPAALPGRVRECLNYEVGFYRGLARIDGFERFDGQTSPSSTNAWRYFIPNADITGAFSAVETLTWTKADRTDEAGVLLSVEDSGTHKGLFIVFRNTTSLPPDGATVTGDTSGASFVVNNTSHDIRKLTDYYSETSTYLAQLGSFADTLRAEVQPVPGGGTIVGLHLHEDKLYAVRDALGLVLNTISPAVVISQGSYLLSPTSQVGEIVAQDSTLAASEGSAATTDHVSLHPVTADGFTVAAGDKLRVGGLVRFRDGRALPASPQVPIAGSGGTSLYNGVVRYIDRRSGSFEAGNAEGFIVFSGLSASGAWSEGESVSSPEGVPGSGTPELAFTVDKVLQQYYTSDPDEAATVVSVDTESDHAALWASGPTSWQLAKTSRRIQFDTGTLDPSTLPVSTGNTGAKASTLQEEVTSWGDAWVGSLDGVETQNDVGPSFTRNAEVDGDYSKHFKTKLLRVRGFKASLDSYEQITGIGVTVRFRGVAATGGTGGRLRVSHRNVRGEVEHAYTTVTNTVWTTVTFGGDGSLWGEERITPSRVNSDDFSFDLEGSTYGGGLEIDYVTMTVYVRQQSGLKWYLRKGSTDVGWIRASSTQLESGAWDGSGTGFFTIFDWFDPTPDVGVEIRSDSGGGGSLLAKVASVASVPLVPGSAKLREADSRYQFMSYNFYASEDRNAIYGVSGAGPAFVYDGENLDFIYTGVERSSDKPRHLAAHQGRLALGYSWGEVYLSSSTSPKEFDAVTLASSHGFGDRITGLMPLSGLALAVFTESSIGLINGAALDSEGTGVEQRVISAKSGAIEYTVQNLGDKPIFADFRGISTIETTEQYGDFASGRKSYDVTPWLARRLQRKSGTEVTDQTVVNSVVVRHKNQYRLFFADGYVLTLTLFGAELTPMCTIQRYWLNSDFNQYCRVFATASGVTTDGRDRVFMSIEDRIDGGLAEEAGYVYELDQGLSFDGGYIDSYFTMTNYFGDDAAKVKQWGLIHLHGQVAGVASLHMSHAVNYEDMDNPELPYEPVVLGANQAPPADELEPQYAKARMTGRGFATSLRIRHSSKLEFPHILQLLSYVDDTGSKVIR